MDYPNQRQYQTMSIMSVHLVMHVERTETRRTVTYNNRQSTLQASLLYFMYTVINNSDCWDSGSTETGRRIQEKWLKLGNW